MDENKATKLLKSRSSVRNFSDEPLPREILDDILKAALRAPSAGNRQPWRIYVVRDRLKKKSLAEAAYGQSFIVEAPVACVVCAVPSESAHRYGERGRDLYSIQDTAALTYSILLSAHFAGYAGCWIGAFNEEDVSTVLALPSTMRPVSIIPLGRAAPEEETRTSRKPLSEVVVRQSEST
ncbi:MAG: nitroreductase family protein [Candidatus Thorarchaeota archaeon]